MDSNTKGVHEVNELHEMLTFKNVCMYDQISCYGWRSTRSSSTKFITTRCEHIHETLSRLEKLTILIKRR